MISRTDKLIILAIFSIYLVFVINVKLDSTIPLYFGVLIAGGIFLYCIIKLDPFEIARESLIIGIISGIIYSYVDKLFSENLLIITYLRADIYPYTAAPLSLIMVWSLIIAFLIYFYRRMNSFFKSIYIPSLFTGILAFVISLTLGQLGDFARLWNWNHLQISSPFIGNLPLYVPIGAFLSFLFSAFFVRKISSKIVISSAIIGGIRCGIVIGMGQFISYLVMRKWFHYFM